MLSATDLYDLPLPELRALLGKWGARPAHAARLWRYLYHDRVGSLEDLPELPASLREHLQRNVRIASPAVAAHARSHDGLTEKYLLQLADGARVETVLMRLPGRVTACLSTQAGCGLGCVFCATGQQGFTRNLSTGEIVAQAVHVARASREPLRNVVLMGMGEPLQNYDAVMKALDVLRDPGGLAIGVKRITLSTVGIVPGILRLAEEARPYSLAVSLHAATQAERLAMLPVARAWPLDELLSACRYYTAKLQRRIFFEWTLIEGANDSPEQAHLLASLLGGLAAHVNLLPLNLTSGYAGAPTRSAQVREFQAILRAAGLPSTVRQRRGLDIAAGCGQLAGMD